MAKTNLLETENPEDVSTVVEISGKLQLSVGADQKTKRSKFNK